MDEKFLNLLEASDSSPEFRAELSAFVAEISTIFEPHQLAEYPETARQTEPLAELPRVELLPKVGEVHPHTLFDRKDGRSAGVGHFPYEITYGFWKAGKLVPLGGKKKKAVTI